MTKTPVFLTAKGTRKINARLFQQSIAEFLIQEALETTKGIKINGINITNIRYADDTVLLAASEYELQAVNIKAEGTKLEEVEYKYLGQWITADGRCLEEVKRRIGRAKSKFWELKELIRKDLNIKLKKRILETHLFDSQLWL
ncbi:uncharacterized protein [Penaeus vannamei]|uniref:uncharacterized protein n=1 Tax=Penaeus vannamei TaxID=6689 RepID=UPI00387F776D